MSNSKEYASKLNEMTTNTTESLLEIGLIFVDAKKNLNDVEYEEFLRETSYESETATVRKWICIGNSYIRLKPIANSLPPTFSVLYKVSTLDAQCLDKLVKDKTLRPSVTLKEIEDSIRIASTSTPKPTVVLKFDPLVHETNFIELIEILKKLSTKNSIELKMNLDAENLYQTANVCIYKEAAQS